MNNIQDFYNINQFPGDYDVTYCVSAATNGFNPYINFILDNIKKDDKIIDVGCGTGYITNTIATLKQNDITGLDFSNAIKIAKGKSILQKLIKGEEISVEDSGLSKREWNELMIAFNLEDKVI